ncbi:replicative DNA helicase DnaB [Nostoc commune NIES-4072]|uniref:Replicative DNA helicase n=1 Tax=Nostoc commune NIES-4072 TaxID=2005467 RepID=A0A2R5G4B2_NOSCO|nr:replicative DNA helicase [Nostoc commune]BBD70638.1 replicative DNA helicase DnaB [Nostoc commune HK-02]GBG23293.1 replicative DNA helicase DnaB [Nostoc commune NIES-4072]
MTKELDFSSQQDRLPPQSIEAEEAILGGIMLDPNAMSRISDRLVADAFYINAHKDIYQAAQRLYSQGLPTDLLYVTSWLSDNGLLFRIGGRNKLATLFDRTVSAVNIDALADLVMEKYQRRQLIQAGTEIVKLGYVTETEFSTVLDQAEQKVYGIASEHSAADLVHISHSLANTFTEIEARHAGTASPAVSTGFYDFDSLLGGGFCKGRLYVLAARPSVGKSALAGNLALNVAFSGQLPVCIFSLEMSTDEYAQRFLSSESSIENNLLETGRVSNNQWQPLSQAIASLSELPIFINDNSCPSLTEIRSQVRRVSSHYGGVGLVVVDYLQLMAEGTDSRANMTERVGEISRGLKKLAKDLDVPVLALSQLSREVEHRNDKRPILSDLRSSGAVEQDSDVVIMLYREEMHNPDTPDRGIAELIVRKQRNGPTGTVKLLFDHQFTKFKNLSRGRSF